MAFDRPGFERAVGALLQAARSRRNLTQGQLAEAIGIPRASYANLEAGRQRIPVDVLWRAAVVLGVPIVALVPEAIYRPKTTEGGQQLEDKSRTTSQDLTTLLKTPLLTMS